MVDIAKRAYTLQCHDVSMSLFLWQNLLEYRWFISLIFFCVLLCTIIYYLQGYSKSYYLMFTQAR